MALIESGDLFFFYLPRSGQRQVAGLEDLARTSLLLSPQPAHLHRARHQERRHHRLFSIHDLRLPRREAGEARSAWLLLEAVAGRPEELAERLGPPPRPDAVVEKGVALVRPAGEGRYALVDHGEHQHLAYVLELPREPGPVQQALNIARRASFTIEVKAPDVPSPIPPHPPPRYPSRLRELLAPWELAPLLSLALLDYPMTEVLLTASAEDVVDEIALAPDREFDTTAETFRRLRLDPQLHPTEPLVTGAWA